MQLIADAGSTKTQWILIDGDTDPVLIETRGINPYYQSREEILSLLETVFSAYRKRITSLSFYGAGCTPEQLPPMKQLFSSFFSSASVEVNSDLLAAARSLGQSDACIVGILGTGSNSCFYDGKDIRENRSPLGFILGDEGSGAVLGRKLIGDILKKQLPDPIVADFHADYPIASADIIYKVYREPFPNRFLAGFAPFLKKHITDESVRLLVVNSFREYIERNLLHYEQIRSLPIRFTGSIAWYFRDELAQAMDSYLLSIDALAKDPVNGLIEYHKNRAL